MKKILFFIPALFFLACNLPDKNQADTSSKEKPMKFSATLPNGQVYDVLATGDTNFYKKKDTTVLVTYTYQKDYIELHPKSGAPPPNQAPTARAGNDVTIQLPVSSTKLDATGSTDPEGGALKFYWRQTAGPSQATMADTNKAICTASNLKAGSYQFEVRAVDPLNAFTADYVTVVVKAEVVTPPTGSTTPFSFTTIPFSDPDLVRYGGGAEQWHDRNDVNLGYIPKDVYYRFVATRIATSQRGVYNWSYLDGLINAAIGRGQKFSFGIMTSYPEGTTNEGLVNIGNGTASYPAWLQAAMNGEWLINNSWVANYNDPTYLAWVLELNQAIYSHLSSTFFNGVRYKDVINFIDIRSYGSWGEWHSANLATDFKVSQYPSGTFPTAASLKKIVDAYVQGFPDIQLSCMIAAFDAQWLDNTWNPAEIAYYVLTQRNQKGMIGWRRDQWGATDNYIKDYLENNNRSFNGLTFKDSIMVRYKTAPVTGEPPSWIPNDYADLERQIRLYHAVSFGNGNYGTNSPNSTIQTRVKASSKAAGYRLAPTSGEIKTGGNLTITVAWTNSGLSPAYDNWNVVYDLIDAGGAVRYSFTSQFKPRLFIPATTTTTKTVTDVFSGVAAGTYKINMRVSESYRGNMPLFVTARNSDNSVTLATGIKF